MNQEQNESSEFVRMATEGDVKTQKAKGLHAWRQVRAGLLRCHRGKRREFEPSAEVPW